MNKFFSSRLGLYITFAFVYLLTYKIFSFETAVISALAILIGDNVFEQSKKIEENKKEENKKEENKNE